MFMVFCPTPLRVSAIGVKSKLYKHEPINPPKIRSEFELSEISSLLWKVRITCISPKTIDTFVPRD